MRKIGDKGLTIEEINRICEEFYIEADPIVGFKVNPADLRVLKDMSIGSLPPGPTFIIPSMGGLHLYPIVDIPEGYVEPIRRSQLPIK